MAGTFMLYPPGTDGAAVTEVRLHGSRSSQHPESRNTRTHWIRGFITFQLVRRARIAMLMVPVCPESGFPEACHPATAHELNGICRITPNPHHANRVR